MMCCSGMARGGIGDEECVELNKIPSRNTFSYVRLFTST